jgi:hypothetical protein
MDGVFVLYQPLFLGETKRTCKALFFRSNAGIALFQLMNKLHNPKVFEIGG